MPKARKSPSMWYARATQLKAMADALQKPDPKAFPYGRECERDEAFAVWEVTRDRLLRESERCWAEGGRLELQKEKDLIAELEREAGKGKARPSAGRVDAAAVLP